MDSLPSEPQLRVNLWAAPHDKLSFVFHVLSRNDELGCKSRTVGAAVTNELIEFVGLEKASVE